MANTIKLPPALVISQSPMVDGQGRATFAFLKLFQGMYAQIANAFNKQGDLIAEISASAVIGGRTEGIGTTVGNINAVGVVQPPGVTPASPAAQGAVILPAGATSHTLGTAAMEDASSFDDAGAAATAQSNAETFATTAANAAQSNAEAFASNASNLSSGTVPTARLGGISGTVTLAALTTGGTQGSITLDHGLVTAVVQPT